MEKEWIFEHKQMERELAMAQCRLFIGVVINQPNLTRNNLIRKPSINTNSMSVFLLRGFIRKKT
jgi:hypothetical protein